MDLTPFQIQNYLVLLMGPNGVVVPTPLSLTLPIPTLTDNTPAIIVGNVNMFKSLLPFEESPFSVEEVTYNDPYSIWTTHRNAAQPTSFSTGDPTPLELDNNNQEHLQKQDDTPQDHVSEDISANEDNVLAKQLQENLIIEEPNLEVQSDSSSKQEELSSSSPARGLQSGSKKIKKVRFREWRWSPPEIVTPYSHLINSRAAFKMVFYCLNLQDSKRVFKMDDYRMILRKLGYTQPLPEYGLVNSARSHVRHFRKYGNTPKGKRLFLEMVQDKSKLQKYIDLADALLLHLNTNETST